MNSKEPIILKCIDLMLEIPNWVDGITTVTHIH